ncbi:MAG: TauD/TfdA family dioxygenase [Rhodocyclaceae bacterium]
MIPATPFDLENDAAYRAWRSAKLAGFPRQAADLLVPVVDPANLTAAERNAILDRCARANMAIYLSRCGEDADKAIPFRLAAQLGLTTLDGNYLADEDGITPIAVAPAGTRTAYIPYTTRPIQWHTDGYYNPPGRQIRGMVLHCVRNAERGGENALLDHEIAYILLRDQNPEHIRALMAEDAMTIPAREEDGEVARGDQPGPVFSIGPDGALHMRYTARTRSIVWKDDSATRSAVEALVDILGGASPFIFRLRLEPGMGLVCNNVLHDRAGFDDSPARPRLLYRARYCERVGG